MSLEEQTTKLSRCLNCGFEAPGGDEQWVRLEVPGLGRMTQCPDCLSTNVITGR
ncbi:hypothetical protein ACLI4U_00735 [Natrialbaceae archaeon A-CW2]|uniref:hypothetical protein n=1 Tax=Natronosalvus amylolyticus TaxID=2961994 RepID=UPI0020C93A9D|nr:hypothetical protein [Natronosalvus amylolyticus]